MSKRNMNNEKRMSVYRNKTINKYVPLSSQNLNHRIGSLKIRIKNSNCQRSSVVTQKQILFKDALFLWKTAVFPKLKASTQAKYEYLIDRHILPEFADYELSQLTVCLLNSYASQKLKTGRLNNNSELSPAYVRLIMLIISSTMNFAAEQKLCSPLVGKIYKPIPQKKDITVLSITEQQNLEMYLKNNMDATKLGILICLYTGLRIGEICSLRWSDIDLNSKIIKVRSTVSRIKKDVNDGFQTTLIIDAPKTNSSVRDIPIFSMLYPIISYEKTKATSEYVVSDNPDFVSPRTFEYRFHKILNSCDIRSVNFHALRHTFATRCVEAGIDVKTLSEILGHSNVGITLNTYVHPSMDLKREQLEKITRII